MNSELQANLIKKKKLTNPSSSMIQLSSQNSILICLKPERSLEKLQIGTNLLEMGKSINSEAWRCCGSFSASWSQTFHDQIARPLNLLCFCKMAISVVHPCLH